MPPRRLYPELPAALAAVSAQLQSAFGPDLEAYAARVRSAESGNSTKIINDPVWRTIRLEPFEVVLLDSPLLQRLRRVRQLGLASYVFPGANYSRFEHSLGALHQAQQMIEAIKRNARSSARQQYVPPLIPLSESDEILIRTTALTHDVGHGFLSHVSERAIERLRTIDGNQTIRQLRQQAKAFFGSVSHPAVGEILSALCIMLPEWQDVLTCAKVPHWAETQSLSFEVARLICGGRDPKRPFLSEIISGPLDVDKLDYIPRDCYMAGVPMPVDVDRLMEKIQVVAVAANAVPGAEYSLDAGIDPIDPVQVLAVQTAGARAFEELVISRFLLFEKLYYHQMISLL